MSMFVMRYELSTLGQCPAPCCTDNDHIQYSVCGLPLVVVACCVQSVIVVELVAVQLCV